MSFEINGKTYTKPELIPIGSEKQADSQESSSSGGEESLEAAMAILQIVLSALESDYMRQQNHSESGQIEMGNLMTEVTNTECKNKVDNLQDQISNNTTQTGLQKTFKALEIIGAVVISAVSILLGNPEVAIAIVTMSVLSETGAMSDLTDDIAKGFTNLLKKVMPADTAQKLGDVLAACVVSAVTIVATLGTGAACGALVSTETLTEDGVAEADSLLTRLSKGAKSASKTALMTGTQALAGTNAIVDIFELAAVNASNPKVKETMEILGEIAQIIVSIVGMLAGGLGSAPEEAEGLLSKLGDKVSSLSSNIQDLSAKIGEKLAQLDEANLKYLAIASNIAIPGIEAVPGIGMGVTDIELGNLENQLAQVNAGITELKSSLQLNQSDLKASQNDAKQMLKSFEMLITNVSDYIAPMKATTNVLASGI